MNDVNVATMGAFNQGEWAKAEKEMKKFNKTPEEQANASPLVPHVSEIQLSV